MADGERRSCTRSRAWNRAQWREHVLACARSGLSGVEYCRRHGLHPKSLYRWRRALRECGEEEGGDAAEGLGDGRGMPAFAEVRMREWVPPAAASAIEVVLGGERRLRIAPGFDEETLGRVVRVLEGLGC